MFMFNESLRNVLRERNNRLISVSTVVRMVIIHYSNMYFQHCQFHVTNTQTRSNDMQLETTEAL